jgi:long-chain acyl-CoA synthetase
LRVDPRRRDNRSRPRGRHRDPGGMCDASIACMTRLESVRNLIELADTSVTRFATRPLFGERHGDAWQWITYAEWQASVDALRGGLARLDVKPGDRIAVVSRNGAAWATAAYASYGLGAVFVPLYEVQRPEDWELCLRDCGATIVFGRTPEIAAALDAMRPRLPALRHVLVFEGDAADPRSLVALERYGRLHPMTPRTVAAEDVAGLVYTSGTSGIPKGVMLTHANLTSNVIATVTAFPIGPSDRTLSFLPWAHVYGQVVELHILIAAGASTAFNVDTEHLLDDLHEVKPTILVAVPRVFNRLHAAVQREIAHRPRFVQRLFARALGASIRRNRGERVSLVDRLAAWIGGLLFAAVRRKLGGHLRYAISASATLSREVGEFIDGLGIAVYEGYGLTETSPVVAMNRPGMRKLGSVGIPIKDVRIEIDTRFGDEEGEGEIVVYGPNIMKGYHARPEENARAFTSDGGFRTGDLGRIDADGYLFITGRIKEQYKLENGKYVMPSPLEEKLAMSPFIRNVMLHGANHPYNVALVVIDEDLVRGWAAEHGVALADDVTRDARVIAMIKDELARESNEFRSFERPRDCVLTTTQFTVENGLLTPTLKLKRREVIARYGTALEALYDKHEPAPARATVPRAVAPAV